MIGIDEVGRGAWAGPLLVVAARQLGDLPQGLTDSKLMTKKQRSKILNRLSISCNFGEGWVNPIEIDQFGLAEAMRIALSRALGAIQPLPIETIIMDGTVNYLPAELQFSNKDVILEAKADRKYPIVSAASVYAKVNRDSYMAGLASSYPQYSFENHVGYGTAEHKKAIEEYGVINGLHRMSFKPIKALAKRL